MSFKVEEQTTVKESEYHILIDKPSLRKQKDTEYDWRDRIKQWWRVAKSKGAIVDLGAKSQLNSNSVSLASLGLL